LDIAFIVKAVRHLSSGEMKLLDVLSAVRRLEIAPFVGLFAFLIDEDALLIVPSIVRDASFRRLPLSCFLKRCPPFSFFFALSVEF
jgi:hypothetical protein